MLDTLKHLVRLLAHERRSRWALLVFLALVASGFEMLGAVLVYTLLVIVVDPSRSIEIPVLGDIRQRFETLDEQAFLYGLVLALAVFFLLRAAVQLWVTYAQQRVAHNAGARLSVRLIHGYMQLPYAAHLNRNSAELIRNGHQAVLELVVHVFLPVIRVAAELILVVAMVTMLLLIAPAATALAVAVVGTAAALLGAVVQPRLRRLGKQAHGASRESLSHVQQAFQGIRDIILVGRERFFAIKYRRAREQLARAHYLNATFGELPRIVTETALVGFILLFFALAVTRGDGAQGALSVLGLFAYVGLRLQPSLQRIVNGLNELKYSSAAIEDIDRDLRSFDEYHQAPNKKVTIRVGTGVTLADVTFRYEGATAPALGGVDLTIRPGEVIGVCGPTGGGKTTLIDLISGLLEPTAGRITVDGQDLASLVGSWRAQLGVVSQSVFLLDDTIRRNIALGIDDHEIDEVRLRDAVRMAQLDGLIRDLPDDLDTEVGERGVRISGGQRQRIAIARALYREAKVLIFDEGTSALDNKTEAELMASIDGLRGNCTMILIAHRLSTVRNCDRIVFLEDGHISGIDQFDVLRRNNARFAAMAQE